MQVQGWGRTMPSGILEVQLETGVGLVQANIAIFGTSNMAKVYGVNFWNHLLYFGEKTLLKIMEKDYICYLEIFFNLDVYFLIL